MFTAIDFWNNLVISTTLKLTTRLIVATRSVLTIMGRNKNKAGAFLNVRDFYNPYISGLAVLIQRFETNSISCHFLAPFVAFSFSCNQDKVLEANNTDDLLFPFFRTTHTW
jgi:hypothetical protein